ncbi:MAG: pyruvate ferredoxin oxidoreductase [Planctomycetes bacterium]|nr:pyruvate ferredoxin oxidoreductase [Planctomycetota bacterium]
MRDVITGNEAVAWGAARARAQVVPAYPITPQTTIIEGIADLIKKGELKAEYIPVESEHSAMAACIGAAYAGARAFTATSSQGLLLMHELLHWAALARVPIVMAEVNRAVAPGWTIWTDQNDSLAQRDTGWIQLYCQDAQEVFDTTVQAFRIAEEVDLPVMIVLDAFVLSHTAEPVDVPDAADVDRFLPPRKPKFVLDVDNPCAFGGLNGPDVYQEFRFNQQASMTAALEAARRSDNDWAKMFGRRYGLIEEYRTEGADTILVASATPASTAQDVVDKLRAKGKKVGLVRVRLFRPFPAVELRKALAGAKRVAVLDRNISPGHHGIFCEELKSALYGMPKAPEVRGFIGGLGGRDLTPDSIEEVFDRAMGPKKEEEIAWIGHKA